MKATVITSNDVNDKIQYPMSYKDVYAKLFDDDHHTGTYDVDSNAVTDDAIKVSSYNCIKLPSTVILECPHREIGGKNTTFEDLILISKLCRDNNIAIHMDGARIWEAATYYNESHAIMTCSSDNIVEGVILGDTGSDIIREPKGETMQETILRVASLFDSIYVSTYKGLGAMTGSLLVGSKEFIQEARIWLRRFGGKFMRCSNVYGVVRLLIS